MKIIKLGERELTLQAETQPDVVWLAQSGAPLRIKGDLVEATVAFGSAPARLASGPPLRVAPNVGGSRLDAEEEARRRKVYDETANDSEASRALDITDSAFRKWREVRGLPNRFQAAVPKPQEETPGACPVKECPVNRGGSKHYHQTPEGRLKKVASGTKLAARMAGKEVPDASAPKATPSVVASSASGGEPRPPASDETKKNPIVPDIVGTVVTPPELDQHRFVEQGEAPTRHDPEPHASDEFVTLTFDVQPDGRRIGHLKNGKAVLIEIGFREGVQAGEPWVCKLEHFPTFATAYPVKRAHAGVAPQPEPVAQPPAQRPADLPRPVSTPKQPEKPKRLEPGTCLTCLRKMTLLPNGSLGHRSQDDATYHARMMTKQGVGAHARWWASLDNGPSRAIRQCPTGTRCATGATGPSDG